MGGGGCWEDLFLKVALESSRQNIIVCGLAYMRIFIAHFDITQVKLKYYGVDGAALGLFKSYLKDRKQYVDIDRASSEMKPIITCVPQEPLLFM